MTVKCIPQYLKDSLMLDFVCGTKTLNEMAREAEVSRRTIIRMLEEHDVDPGIHRRNRKKKVEVKNETCDVVVSLVHELIPSELEFVPQEWQYEGQNEATTWLDKIRNRIKNLLASIYA